MYYEWTRSRFNCEFNVAVVFFFFFFFFFFFESFLLLLHALRIVIPAPRGAAPRSWNKQTHTQNGFLLFFVEGARAAGGKPNSRRKVWRVKNKKKIIYFFFLFVYSTKKRRRRKRWSRAPLTVYAGCCILGGRRRCSLPASGLIQIASHIERWASERAREREKA